MERHPGQGIPRSQASFQKCSHHISTRPEPIVPYVMYTDACSTGISAALLQEKDGQIRNIAFFSKQLSKAEAHYSATELETFAIVSAVKHFAAYLHGSFVDIFSDHKPLSHLATMVNDNKRLMRWVSTLQQFPHRMHSLCSRRRKHSS